MTCKDIQGFRIKYIRKGGGISLSLWDAQEHQLLKNGQSVEIHPRSIHYSLDGRHWRIMDDHGRDIFPRGYDLHNTPVLMGDDRYVYKKDQFYGLIDLEGRDIIPCDFEEVLDWDDHFISLKKGNDRIVLNRFGDVIIPEGFDDIHILGDGLFQVEKSGKQALYMMEEGFITSYDDYSFTSFYEGIAGYRRGKEEWGLIDATGKNVSVPDLINLEYLESGIFIFCFDLNRWGVLDDHQNILFPTLYSWIESLGNGYLVLTRAKKSGLVDIKGQEILPFIFKGINSLDHHTFLCQDQKGYLFFDEDGHPMFMEHFSYATPFLQGAAQVVHQNENYLLNEKGQILSLEK